MHGGYVGGCVVGGWVGGCVSSWLGSDRTMMDRQPIPQPAMAVICAQGQSAPSGRLSAPSSPRDLQRRRPERLPPVPGTCPPEKQAGTGVPASWARAPRRGAGREEGCAGGHPRGQPGGRAGQGRQQLETSRSPQPASSRAWAPGPPSRLPQGLPPCCRGPSHAIPELPCSGGTSSSVTDAVGEGAGLWGIRTVSGPEPPVCVTLSQTTKLQHPDL